jgi:hypothetical protein
VRYPQRKPPLLTGNAWQALAAEPADNAGPPRRKGSHAEISQPGVDMSLRCSAWFAASAPPHKLQLFSGNHGPRFIDRA